MANGMVKISSPDIDKLLNDVTGLPLFPMLVTTWRLSSAAAPNVGTIWITRRLTCHFFLLHDESGKISFFFTFGSDGQDGNLLHIETYKSW